MDKCKEFINHWTVDQCINTLTDRAVSFPNPCFFHFLANNPAFPCLVKWWNAKKGICRVISKDISATKSFSKSYLCLKKNKNQRWRNEHMQTCVHAGVHTCPCVYLSICQTGKREIQDLTFKVTLLSLSLNGEEERHRKGWILPLLGHDRKHEVPSSELSLRYSSPWTRFN